MFFTASRAQFSSLASERNVLDNAGEFEGEAFDDVGVLEGEAFDDAGVLEGEAPPRVK